MTSEPTQDSLRDGYFEYVEFYDHLLAKMEGISPSARQRLEALRNDIQALMDGALYTDRNVRSLRTAERHLNAGFTPTELGMEDASTLEEERAQDSLAAIARRLEDMARKFGPRTQLLLSNLYAGSLPNTAAGLLLLLVMYADDADANNARRAQRKRGVPQA